MRLSMLLVYYNRKLLMYILSYYTAFIFIFFTFEHYQIEKWVGTILQEAK